MEFEIKEEGDKIIATYPEEFFGNAASRYENAFTTRRKGIKTVNEGIVRWEFPATKIPKRKIGDLVGLVQNFVNEQQGRITPSPIYQDISLPKLSAEEVTAPIGSASGSEIYRPVPSETKKRRKGKRTQEPLTVIPVRQPEELPSEFIRSTVKGEIPMPRASAEKRIYDPLKREVGEITVVYQKRKAMYEYLIETLHADPVDADVISRIRNNMDILRVGYPLNIESYMSSLKVE